MLSAPRSYISLDSSSEYWPNLNNLDMYVSGKASELGSSPGIYLGSIDNVLCC